MNEHFLELMIKRQQEDLKAAITLLSRHGYSMNDIGGYTLGEILDIYDNIKANEDN